MTKAPARAARLAGPRLRRNPAAWAAVILMAGGGLAWAGPAAWEAIQTWGTPTCSWPLQVRGTASPAQAGLVPCYLRDLASRDTAGLAAAAFTPNAVDPTSAFVTITYANGVRENASMMNMIAMGGSSGWRMNIGTDINSGSSGPPPAAVSPSP